MDQTNDKSNLEKKAEKITIRSEEVQDILGTPPGWLVRWGIGVMFAAVMIVLLGSGFFMYPDTVKAPVIITTENPPSVIAARAGGRLETIFNEDGKSVNRNDTLAVIENPASYRDVFRLRTILKELNSKERPEEFLLNFSFPGDMVLGEIQPAYNRLLKASLEYRLFDRQDLYAKKIGALEDELKEYEDYHNILKSRERLVLEELDLIRKQFARDSALYANDVISSSDYEKARSEVLAAEKEVESARVSLSNAAVTIARLKHNITDTMMEEEERRQDLLTELNGSLRQLESSIAEWERKYLMVATTDGVLNYVMTWSELQEVRAGDPVFTVVPREMGELQGRLILPQRRAGKVSPGQRVNIKLDGYPFMEYGMLEARVESISSGPLEGGFPVVLSLTKGAVTSYGYELEVVRELSGEAEITTEEMSLLERLVSPIRHLLRHHIRDAENQTSAEKNVR